MEDVINWLMENGLFDFDNVGVVLRDFFYFLVLVFLFYMWGNFVKVVYEKMVNGGVDDLFYVNKLKVGCYFFDCMFLDVYVYFVKLKFGVELVMVFDDEVFLVF